MVEDCYSTSHYRGHQSSGVYPHRSRPSHAGWGSEAWDSGLHRLTNTTKFVYKPKKCSSIKRVSFAYPLSQMMGEQTSSDVSLTDFSCQLLQTSQPISVVRSDPMRDELSILPVFVGHPTKEARILEMLSEAGGERGGWHASPVASPFAAQENPMEAEEVPEEGEIQREEEAGEAVEEAPFAARSPSPSNTQVVQQVSEIENNLINGAVVSTSPEDNEINDLTSFINYISCAPPVPVLHTPPRVNNLQTHDEQSSRVQHISTETPLAQRKSTRLADKAKLNPVKGSLNLAQRVLLNKLGELSPKLKQKANMDFNSVVQHFQQPVTKMTMDALTVLVEQGNKAVSKKKSKVAPMPAGDAGTQMA